MDLLKKLEDCAKRYEVVQQLIMDPDLVKDPVKYKNTMRENGHLSEVCALYEEYKKVLQGIEDDKIIITEEEDQDMKEMAREELKELEERVPQLEAEIKLKLIKDREKTEKEFNLLLNEYKNK